MYTGNIHFMHNSESELGGMLILIEKSQVNKQNPHGEILIEIQFIKQEDET